MARLVTPEGMAIEGTPSELVEFVNRLSAVQEQEQQEKQSEQKIIEGLSGEIQYMGAADQLRQEIKQRVNGRLAEFLERQKAKPETRDDVIKKAVGWTMGLRVEHAQTGNPLPEFIVNRDKRTVTVLLKNKSGAVYMKGYAKCTPDDCFNVSLGKAIALGRALGKVIPLEFLNPPQPKTAEVGDVIEWKGTGGKQRVYTITGKRGDVYKFRTASGTDLGWLRYTSIETVCRVIDDSRF